MDDHDAPDRLTLTQLRQVAGPTPQPYCVHVQVDSRSEKQTSTGAPFLEVKLADASDSMVWRVFDNNPLFPDARAIQRGSLTHSPDRSMDPVHGRCPGCRGGVCPLS